MAGKCGTIVCVAYYIFRFYCLLQEKGDMDRAIQYYKHAIQVRLLCDD
jgi:hypothetical protein